MEPQPTDGSNTYPLKAKEGEQREEEQNTRYDRLALKLFGDFFRTRREQFGSYQQWLNQARNNDGYVLYLSRLLLIGTVLLGVSLLLTLFVTLSVFGVIPVVEIGVAISNALGINLGVIQSIPDSAISTVQRIGPLLFGVLVGVAFLLFFVVAPMGVLYVVPWYRAAEREREIDTMMPYVVTFTYALSRGGANLVEVLRTVSDSEDVYGEAAQEFRFIAREMDYFDSDLRTALRAAAATSPSSDFTAFIDDLRSVVQTGGDLEDFLYSKTQDYLDKARRDQEKFLDTLAILGETYVVMFVAAPLFAIVILTVMGFVNSGGFTILLMYGLVYGLLTIGNFGFAILLDTLNTSKNAEASLDDFPPNLPLEELENVVKSSDSVDPRIKNLYESQKRIEQYKLLFNPVETLRENPYWSLVVSFPLVMVYIAGAAVLYGLPTDIIANVDRVTAVYFSVPLVIIALPVSYFYRKRATRENQLLDKLPSVLKSLSQANETGMTLTESFGVTADNTSGEMGDELRKVRRELEWLDNVNRALSRFARRIGSSRVTRVVKLIIKANRSTGNITDVLEVATKDVTQTQELESDRKSEMRVYTFIVWMAFLVYLLVIVLMQEAFLSRISKISVSGTSGSGGQAAAGGQFSLGNLPVDQYNMIFFHSSIIQAIGSGLISGQMSSGNYLTGLRNTILMVILATGVFVYF